MERFVAEWNIRHYRELLAGELERDERDVIERLLAEEEVKLDTLRKTRAPAELGSAPRASSLLA